MKDGAVFTDDMQPAYIGIIRSIEDALVLVEACLRGSVTYVYRIPTVKESALAIRSGNIFIFGYSAPGSRHWKDGGSWRFTKQSERWRLYRQIDEQQQNVQSKPSPITIEQKQAFQDGLVEDTVAKSSGEMLPAIPNSGTNTDLIKPKANLEKSVNEPSTSKGITVKEGLVKETITFKCGSMTYRLISYYSLADAREEGKLQIPSTDPKFIGFGIRRDLVGQYFKISEADSSQEFKVNGVDIKNCKPLFRFKFMGGVGLPEFRNGVESSQSPDPDPNKTPAKASHQK